MVTAFLTTTVASTLNRGRENGLSMTIIMTVAAAVLISAAAFRTTTKRNDRLPLSPENGIAVLKALNKGETIEFFLRCAKNLNFPAAFRIWVIPGRSWVILSDPELARDILTDKATRKPASLYQGLSSVLGTSMITEMDDVKWKQRRKGVAPAFSSNHIQRMNRICMEHIERWIDDRLEPMIEKGEAFDPSIEMINLTISVICEAAFDQIPSDEDIQMFLTENRHVLLESSKRIRVPGRLMVRHLLEDSRRAMQAAEITKDLGRKFLIAHRAKSNPEQGTVVDCIDKNPYYEDDDERMLDIVLFIIAGHDTSGYSLAWALYALAQHPEEHQKILSDFQNLPEAEWTSSSVLQKFIREVMRLYPVAAGGSARVVGRDFEAKDGTIVSKGSLVLANQMVMNRNPKVYLDPELFFPDRWDKPEEMAKMPISPFSSGPRNCVGQGLATAELNSSLAKLAGHFRFELVKDYKPKFFVTHKPEGGLIRAKRV